MSDQSIKLEVKHPNYVMFSSDFSQQEPKLTGFVAADQKMCQAFAENKDIYAFIAAIAFHKTYEECLEFHPVTGEYQPEGKKRRTESKSVVLGICYGRSIPSIGQQLYASNDNMTDEEKTSEAQMVYDSVLQAFPNLKNLMIQSQNFAKQHGYVETILGRRRHIPDMMLDEFEFEPMDDYVNPDIDPLDPSTMVDGGGLPEKKVQELKAEFSKYKYFGQIARRTKELYDKEHIRVRNNRSKINDAKRQCVNCVDFETEILTENGWKHYDEVSVGDKIVAYSLEEDRLVWDEIKEVIISDVPTQVYALSTRDFDAVCTKDHRWVMRNWISSEVKIKETSSFINKKRPRYNILRKAVSTLSDESPITESVDVLHSKYLDGTLESSEVLHLPFETADALFKRIFEEERYQGHAEYKDQKRADIVQLIGVAADRLININKDVQIRKSIGVRREIYRVTLPKRYPTPELAWIPKMDRKECEVPGVWCVSTNTSTWFARRNGKPYITGNSIIQGSAADFTKMALLKVTNDPRWKAAGGKILTVVHDEIVAEAPESHWKEAAAVLKEDMEKSGDFLPFPINCDVEATYRWYGMSVDVDYPRPTEPFTKDPEEVKWIQYHLIESEFELPILKGENGEDPIGDAAHGVNGIRTKEMEAAISDYCAKYRINIDEFLDDIGFRVRLGVAYADVA